MYVKGLVQSLGNTKHIINSIVIFKIYFKIETSCSGYLVASTILNLNYLSAPPASIKFYSSTKVHLL